jgi:hypothetical protein
MRLSTCRGRCAPRTPGHEQLRDELPIDRARWCAPAVA